MRKLSRVLPENELQSEIARAGIVALPPRMKSDARLPPREVMTLVYDTAKGGLDDAIRT
jgi:hypothetical protein